MLAITMSLVTVLALGTPPAADTACITMNTERLPLAKRQSPLDSVSFRVGGTAAKVCYGRPSLRGRRMLGDQIPYGRVWRTGANEPTMIHTTGPITIAGVAVPAGSYSLYSIPGETEWEIIVNRSITQWGEESNYPPVQAQDVGRGRVKAEKIQQPVEQFTIRAEPPDNAKALILEWGTTRVRVPVAAGK